MDFEEQRLQVFKLGVIDIRPKDCPYSEEQLTKAFQHAQEQLGRTDAIIRAHGGTPCRLQLWRMNIHEAIKTLVERGEKAFFDDYANHLYRPDEEWLHNRPYVYNMLRIMQSLGIEEPKELRERRDELIGDYAKFQRSMRDGGNDSPRR